MPGALLGPAGLGGVAARLDVMLEETLELRGLPAGRRPSMSCKESEGERQWGRHRNRWQEYRCPGWCKGKHRVRRACPYLLRLQQGRLLTPGL